MFRYFEVCLPVCLGSECSLEMFVPVSCNTQVHWGEALLSQCTCQCGAVTVIDLARSQWLSRTHNLP